MTTASDPIAPAARPSPLAEPLESGHSPWQDAWQRLQDWFSATERYATQLHEVDRAAYLDMKRREYQRMQQ